MKTKSSINRREILKTGLFGGALAGFASLSTINEAAADKHGKKGGKCGNVKKHELLGYTLEPEKSLKDKKWAKEYAAKYKADKKLAGKDKPQCINCTLIPMKFNENCPLFAGKKVCATAYCGSWAFKPNWKQLEGKS